MKHKTQIYMHCPPFVLKVPKGRACQLMDLLQKQRLLCSEEPGPWWDSVKDDQEKGPQSKAQKAGRGPGCVLWL